MHKTKMGTKKISEEIGCSQWSIQRELQRGKVTQFNGVHWIYYETYSADLAQNRYEANRESKGPALKIGHDFELCEYIEKQIIEERKSPDVVIGRIKAEGQVFKTSLCTRTLYNYIDKGIFLKLNNKHLIYGKRRKRKGRKKSKRPSYHNIRGRSIEERSEAVNKRQETGHWEMDCVLGKKQGSKAALLTLTERATRLEIIIKLERKTQEAVVNALDKLEMKMGRKKFVETFKSITVDKAQNFWVMLGSNGL